MKENNEKVLGVIGGMGPLATELFYKMVIEHTRASCDQDHINMIILNHASMPDRTAAIMSGNTEVVFEKLLKDALYIVQGGADYIAIPCNTSHFLLERLKKEVPAGIISMIDSAADAAKEKGAVRAGILATDGTVKMGLYQKALLLRGIEPVVPSAESQKLVMKIIYDGIKSGEKPDYSDFLFIEDELKLSGCDCALLACTELSCFSEMFDLSDYYIDAMLEMALRAVALCGKDIKY